MHAMQSALWKILLLPALILVVGGCKTKEEFFASAFRDQLEAASRSLDESLKDLAPPGEVESAGHVASFEALEEQSGFPEEGIFKNNDAFSYELREARLDQAFHVLGEMGGINLLFRGRFDEMVEFSFKDVLLNDAFRVLLNHFDCRLRLEDGFIVVSRVDPGLPLSHIFTLRSVSAQDLLEPINNVLAGGSPPVVGPEGNTIMITAVREDVLKVAEFLDTVDRPEKQVILESRIMRVELTDLFEMGASLDFTNIHIDDTTAQFLTNFLPESDNATFSVTGDKAAIDGTLRVLQQLTKLETLSRPKVLAKNGQEAKIEVIEEVPYIATTTTVTGTTDGVGTSTVEEVEFKEVGLVFTITPYIKGDNSVELKVLQNLSEQIGEFLNVPVVDRQLLDTRFEVKHGETILIGGLMKTEESDEVSGIPYLMDIPVLGDLFKLTEKTKEQKELIIMITPRVINASTIPGIKPG